MLFRNKDKGLEWIVQQLSKKYKVTTLLKTNLKQL